MKTVDKISEDITHLSKLANEWLRVLFYGVVFVCHLMVVSILYYGVGEHIHVWDFSKIVALSGMWAYVGVITSLLMSRRRPELTHTFNIFGVSASQILSIVGIAWTLWSKKKPQDEKIYLIALYTMNILCTFSMSVGLGFWDKSKNQEGAQKSEKFMEDSQKDLGESEEKITGKGQQDTPKPGVAA